MLRPHYAANVWPQNLRPHGDERNWNVDEPFQDWWARCRSRLGHLHPELCEQWIHGHWYDSPHRYLDLDHIGWERVLWDARTFLDRVASGTDDLLDPSNDFAANYRPGSGEPSQTARALNAGCWDFAPVIMPTPNGFVNHDRQPVQRPYLLIEGHNRRRYLNALVHRGQTFSELPVFIIAPHPSGKHAFSFADAG